jgi:hypothetical protein
MLLVLLVVQSASRDTGSALLTGFDVPALERLFPERK